MSGLVVFLVSVAALFFLALGGRFLFFSWAFSVFTGKRKEVLVWLVLCSVVLATYIATMQLVLR
jgi:hypothetical protein